MNLPSGESGIELEPGVEGHLRAAPELEHVGRAAPHQEGDHEEADDAHRRRHTRTIASQWRASARAPTVSRASRRAAPP